jgi:hypothetical protein
MKDSADRPFSNSWLVASIFIFVALELLVGGFVAKLLAGRNVSHMLGLRMELAMSLLAYTGGGFIVGLISPGRRLLEPAIAASVSVLFTFLIAFFTPVVFFHADPGRMVVGGGIAFVLALFGAHWGEKLTGN